MRGTRIVRWAAAGVMIGVLGRSMMGGSVLAQELPALIDGSPDGVTLTVSAAGEFEPVADADVLTLTGLTIGPCTAFDGTHKSGPILLQAETNEVRVHHTGGNAGIDFVLAQGETVLIPAGRWFTVANGNSDPAMTASVLMLALTIYDDATAFPALDIETMEKYGPWPETGHCTGAHDNLTTRYSVRGRAAEGASKLYLGIGVWDAGATTKGYQLSGDTASFNLLVLSGELPTAGQTSGLAVTYGLGDVASDSPSEPVGHEPFQNPGTAPLIGIVFGTTADGAAVFVAAK
jgi:hypothetical protein